MTTDITHEILAAAPRHTQLLKSRREAAHKHKELVKGKAHYEADKAELTRTNEKIKELKEQTKREQQRHESLRDSFVRRLASSLAGHADDFNARISEQKKWVFNTMLESLPGAIACFLLMPIVRKYADAVERETDERKRKKTLVSKIMEWEARNHVRLWKKLMFPRLLT
jgi:hypothetical protein